MKYKEIPKKCRNCFYMRVWSLCIDGNHEYSCRKLPKSKVGDPNCDMFKVAKPEDDVW